MIVHQVVPSLEYGDAVSNYALLIQRLLREAGIKTRIFSEFIHSKLRSHATPLAKIPARDGTDIHWLLHYSAQTRALDLLSGVRGPVGLVYHNVTPPQFAGALGGDAASAAYVAREQLRDFLTIPRVVAADSAYNAEDLRELGADSVRVMPLAIDFDQFDQRPARHLLAALRGGDGEDCVNFLTVGRLAPHKKLEDAIKVFYYFHNYVNPRSRLHIVGDGTVATEYVQQLLDLVADLAIPNVYFTGKVRFSELLAYYKAADIYLCMSEHEGFCVPLVEAMHMGVPVIAYKQAAVAETLGSAGILVRRKRADAIAEMANILLNEKQFQVKVVEKQRERAADFHIDRLRANLKQFVAALATGGPETSIADQRPRRGDPRLLV